MIEAAVRAAQQLPASPLSTGTPTIYVDPYLGNSTNSVFGNSTTDAAVSSTVDGSDLTASLQSLTDALAAYQDLMNPSATGTGATSMDRKIKMLGDDMLSGIQQIAKRAEMAEQENRKMKKKMKKVLMQRGGLFANKTETAATSKSVMDKMGKGVLERYARMVGGN